MADKKPVLASDLEPGVTEFRGFKIGDTMRKFKRFHRQQHDAELSGDTRDVADLEVMEVADIDAADGGLGTYIATKGELETEPVITHPNRTVVSAPVQTINRPVMGSDQTDEDALVASLVEEMEKTEKYR